MAKSLNKEMSIIRHEINTLFINFQRKQKLNRQWFELGGNPNVSHIN